jgi:hypothetical protein
MLGQEEGEYLTGGAKSSPFNQLNGFWQQYRNRAWFGELAA